MPEGQSVLGGAETPETTVIELRQYKIVPGQREAMIALFDREFLESQEACGAEVLGQFRDCDDPDRFTWIRGFADMEARRRALTGFYAGPVWAANRDRANPMLEDNDNVLLLRPAWAGAALDVPGGTRPVDGAPAAGLVVAVVHYLWKDPAEGFAAFVGEQLAPVLADAGLPVIGCYVPETTPNDFPRLPVRQSEKLLVWFTRVADGDAHASAVSRFEQSEKGRRLGRVLAGFEERARQVLRLAPTGRSRLR